MAVYLNKRVALSGKLFLLLFNVMKNLNLSIDFNLMCSYYLRLRRPKEISRS